MLSFRRLVSALLGLLLVAALPLALSGCGEPAPEAGKKVEVPQQEKDAQKSMEEFMNNQKKAGAGS